MRLTKNNYTITITKDNKGFELLIENKLTKLQITEYYPIGYDENKIIRKAERVVGFKLIK